MHQNIERILLTENEVKCKVQELADKINADYQGKEALCVCILKGSVVVFSDLVRKLTFPVEFDFMVAASYQNQTVSSGTLTIKMDLKSEIEGKHVIIIEDIIDTGRTLYHLKNELLRRNPASLKICAFLDKPSRRTENIDADYVGEIIPDEFAVGYGLDFGGKYRQLPYIGVLKRECYEK